MTPVKEGLETDQGEYSLVVSSTDTSLPAPHLSDFLDQQLNGDKPVDIFLPPSQATEIRQREGPSWKNHPSQESTKPQRFLNKFKLKPENNQTCQPTESPKDVE